MYQNVGRGAGAVDPGGDAWVAWDTVHAIRCFADVTRTIAAIELAESFALGQAIRRRRHCRTSGIRRCAATPEGSSRAQRRLPRIPPGTTGAHSRRPVAARQRRRTPGPSPPARSRRAAPAARRRTAAAGLVSAATYRSWCHRWRALNATPPRSRAAAARYRVHRSPPAPIAAPALPRSAHPCTATASRRHASAGPTPSPRRSGLSLA